MSEGTPDETDVSQRTSELAADYRSRRDAWLARGDELERLRADVRAAAQREAVEIVTRARQDIRRTLTSARRDLIELNAQVKAAGAASEAGPIDLDLSVDVRTLLAESGWPEHPPAIAASGAGAEDRSEAVFVAAGGAETEASLTRRSVVSALAALGIVAVAGILWLVVRPPTANAPATPSAAPQVSDVAARSSAQTEASAPAPASAAPSVPAATALPQAPPRTAEAGPWIEIEAVQEVWMRVTVDGVADAGRIYAAGETRRVDGGEQIAVRVGDGAAATVAVNGGVKAPFGSEGLPITRRFVLDQTTRSPSSVR